MRSYLFVPGDSQRKLEKSLTSGADCLIIDLEDSVAQSQKGVARRCAVEFITRQKSAGNDGPGLIVRVNPLSSDMTEEDLAAVIASRPDGILLPKSESRADIQKLSVMIAVHEAGAGIAEGKTDIHALVTETAMGTLNVADYAGASPRLKTLSWGAEDLSADLGVETNRDETGRYTDLFRFARTQTVFGAAAAGVGAVDTVFVDFRNQQGLETECAAAARDGFTGKMAIHPNQIEPINRIFTPSPEAIIHATRIIDLFEQAGENVGVLSMDGKMIDQPHLKQARRIVERARSAGLE